ncbi:thiamine biosynthesis protein [Salmonella enterica subsp. enterica]|uniref:Thiamine biosynthesis protein n=1 Tax=Salmonella enterica I TaxID=59201 RepID=A0A447N7D1_SALET|nr:thiamine biosynthesis protein [Salmonella enterica subsp. enterica]
MQKDLPDLYVDLSTVGEGYAADHLARLMEQEGIARYLGLGGRRIKQSRDECARAAVARRDSEADRPGKTRWQAIVDINGHGNQHLRQLP